MSANKQVATKTPTETQSYKSAFIATLLLVGGTIVATTLLLLILFMMRI